MTALPALRVSRAIVVDVAVRAIALVFVAILILALLPAIAEAAA